MPEYIVQPRLVCKISFQLGLLAFDTINQSFYCGIFDAFTCSHKSFLSVNFPRKCLANRTLSTSWIWYVKILCYLCHEYAICAGAYRYGSRVFSLFSHSVLFSLALNIYKLTFYLKMFYQKFFVLWINRRIQDRIDQCYLCIGNAFLVYEYLEKSLWGNHTKEYIPHKGYICWFIWMQERGGERERDKTILPFTSYVYRKHCSMYNLVFSFYCYENHKKFN